MCESLYVNVCMNVCIVSVLTTHTHTRKFAVDESLTMCVCLQITTAVTTATRQAAATPVQAHSSNVTAVAASPTTGHAMVTTTAVTTATRPTPTAPIRVSTLTRHPLIREACCLESFNQHKALLSPDCSNGDGCTQNSRPTV